MTSPRVTVMLPSIQNAKITSTESANEDKKQKEAESQKLSRASSFISRLQLGSLHCQRRPGDVWGGRGSKLPRPLGLIPDHQNNFDILKELSRFLPPLTTYSAPRPHTLRPDTLTTEEKVDQEQSTAEIRPEFISADVKKRSEEGMTDATLSQPVPPSYGVSGDPLPYRYPRGEHEDIDQDRLDALATYDLRHYYTTHLPRPLPRPQLVSGETWSGPIQPVRKKQPVVLGRVRSISSGPHFMSFSEKSQLCQRGVSDDRRVPLPGEPCARCLERGGRCQRCKALRVGGGYLILDGDELPDDELKKRLHKRYSYGRGRHWTGEGRDRRRRTGRVKSEGVESGSGSGVSVSGDSEGVTGGGGGGEWSGRTGTGHYGDGSLGSGGGAHGSSGQTRSDWDQEDGGRRGRLTSARGSRGQDGSHDDGLNKRSGGVGGESGDGREAGDRTRTTGDDERRHDTGEGGEGGGRSSSRGTGVGSRPHSTLGSRPGSSLRRGGLDRRTRDKKGAEIKGGRGRGHGRGSGEGDNDSDGSDNDDPSRGRRRRKKGAGDGESGTDDDGIERSKQKFKSTRDAEDERPASGYRGNLMRFKRKKDEVKALHATLQELQGIDPLDYLAKYCIIDQKKLPHYQRCFDNVDRDEDDDIDIGELDFALKAVNYDLISDSEMNYVHSVLELAGRYKLNFRLFSLIAALSEKVVSLEDMVKRLINKMDFEALEVKMKKCKELFYLLADAETQEHEGGVVTTGSLAVELQAGGLTGEHVEFVVDRLNHDNKGLVEFLDYLTYVPLFVEIHDSIYDNPLDFTRSK